MAAQMDVTTLRNKTWSTQNVHNQYSDANAHSDLYRFINMWSDMGMYLNVGYTRTWQRHNTTKNHLRLIDRLADGLLNIRPSCHQNDNLLVDIASGRGGAAIRAQQKYDLNVVGIDFTEFNARQADKNARALHVWPKVRFSMGDAHVLPLKSQSVSLAWSIESPAHFDDKKQFLGEVSRVLKPGGVFVLTDLLVVEPVATASPEHEKIYHDFLDVWDVPYLETYASYVRAFESIGLQVLRSEIATKFNLDIYKRYCRWFLWISSIQPLYASYKNYIRTKVNANLDNIREHSLLSYRALNLGMIDYGLFWVKKA